MRNGDCVIFVVPSKLSIGVIESQIINMARGLYGSSMVILYLHGSGSKKLALSINKHFPDLLVTDQVRCILGHRKDIGLVYIRSVISYVRLLPFLCFSGLNKYILFDFRAILSEESFLRNGSFVRKKLIRQAERIVYLTAPSIRCVSNKLAAYLHDQFGERPINVVPCLIPRSDVVRKVMYISKDRVINLIYVGGMSKWQNFDLICKVVAALSLHTRVNFTVVTLEKAAATVLCKKVGLNDARIISGGREIVLNELDNADFGFLFRDCSIINKTASPIKFLEYLARGVVPIVHGEVGDYTNTPDISDIMVRYDGSILELLKQIEHALSDLTRPKQIHSIAQKLTWEKFGENFV